MIPPSPVSAVGLARYKCQAQGEDPIRRTPVSVEVPAVEWWSTQRPNLVRSIFKRGEV